MEKRPQTVKGTAADQAIKSTLVDTFEINPGAEIEQILERAVLTRLGNGLDRPLAHPLDRQQSLVLLRCQAGLARRGLTEGKKPADRIAELGKRPIVDAFRAAGPRSS